jgi:8-oxo-dGTP pyrophosphatase MutT (NUDIX family)
MKKRVRAVIVQNGFIVLVHRIKVGKEYWVFPGGGLEDSDTSQQEGLKRECLEELGVVVEVDELFMERLLDDQVEDHIEFFYTCHIVSGELGTGKGPEFTRDPSQFGVYEIQRVPISDLAGKAVYPFDVRDRVIGSL